MILSARLVPALALLIALGTLSVVFDLGIGAAPQAFFGDESIAILGPPEGQLPGRATVSAWMVDALRSLPAVETVSPEVYVLGEIGGDSLLARGVEVPAFLEIERASIVEGRAPASFQEALAGRGFASRTGRGVGDGIVLPSTLERTALPFRIVGVFEAEGQVRDELLIPLDSARALASVPGDSAHVVRVRTSDAEQFARLADAVEPTFTVSDLRLSSTSLLVGEPATATVRVTNWGVLPGAHLLEAKQANVTRGAATAIVAGRTSVDVAIPFRLAEGAPTISINPSATVELREPSLNVSLVEDRVTAGAAFHVRVAQEGAPVQNARVTLGDESALTDASGVVELVAPEHDIVVYASRGGAREGFLHARVAPPGSATIFLPRTGDVRLRDALLGEETPVSVIGEVENLGGAAGTAEITLTENGLALAGTNVSLGPGERRTFAIEAPPLHAGPHTLELSPGGLRVPAKVYPGRDPRVALILERSEGTVAPLPGSAESSAADYVAAILGNVSVAVAMLSILSAGLAAMGVVSVLSRHVLEHLGNVGALKAIGASDADVRRIALRDAALVGTLAAAVGVAGGVLFGALLERTGLVRAFGHAIRIAAPLHVLVAIGFASAALIVVVTRVLVSSALHAEVDALLRGQASVDAEEQAPTIERALDTEA